MSKLHRFSGWPGPVWLFLPAMLIMTLGTFTMTSGQLRADYPLWSMVSAAWHESLWIPGSVLATVAALIACSICPRHSTLDNVTRPRSGTIEILRFSGLISMWALLGHALGLVPIHVMAFMYATYGHIDLADIIIGIVGIFFLCSVGFSFGFLTRRHALAPLFGLAMFGIMGLIQEPIFRPLALIFPVRQYIGTTRFETNSLTSLYSIIASLTVALTTVFVVTWIRSRRSVFGKWFETLAWSVVSLGLIAVAFVWRPELVIVDRPVPIDCFMDDQTKVCLHRANLSAKRDVTKAIDSLQGAGLEELMVSVMDYAAVERDYPDAFEVFLDIAPQPRGARALAKTLEEQAAYDIAMQLTLRPCAGNKSANSASRETAFALSNRLLTLAGYHQLATDGPQQGTAVDLFSTFDAASAAVFISEHKSDIENCSLNPTSHDD